MGIWDFRQLQQNLDKKAAPNLVMLFGDEDYLVSEALKLLRQNVLKEGAIDFNYDQFFVGDAPMARIVDTVETLPMMCERRLVVLRFVERLTDKSWIDLFQLFENPVESTCFILVAAKVDKRKKYFKTIERAGQVVELKKPYENQIPAWIEYISFSHNLKLDKEGMHLIHQLVGSNLSEINSEIVKLKQFVGEAPKATAADILQVISKVKVDSVFELTDAIGKRDRVEALTCLANLLEHGQNELGTMAMISRHVRVLETLKQGLNEGLRGAKLCAKVGVPSFFLQKYMSQVNLWKDAQIANTIRALHETDIALKSSPVSSAIWLENFILKTCR